jgi:hypothetical protein
MLVTPMVRSMPSAAFRKAAVFHQLEAWYRTLDQLLSAKERIELALYHRLRDRHGPERAAVGSTGVLLFLSQCRVLRLGAVAVIPESLKLQPIEDPLPLPTSRSEPSQLIVVLSVERAMGR